MSASTQGSRLPASPPASALGCEHGRRDPQTSPRPRPPSSPLRWRAAPPRRSPTPSRRRCRRRTTSSPRGTPSRSAPHAALHGHGRAHRAARGGLRGRGLQGPQGQGRDRVTSYVLDAPGRHPPGDLRLQRRPRVAARSGCTSACSARAGSTPATRRAAPAAVRPGRQPETLLAVSDLVFIDPVSTGYSRAVEGGKPKEYHGFKGDIECVGELIRLWTTRHNRWLSPKFIAGESYGTTRAAALAEHLQARHGLYLNGIMLIGSVLDLATVDFEFRNDRAHVDYLPTYAATAHYHGKHGRKSLKTVLAEAEEYAARDYPWALSRGNRLTAAERAEHVGRLASLIGLSEGYVDRADLRVEHVRFFTELLREEGLAVGRLDARFTGPLGVATPRPGTRTRRTTPSAGHTRPPGTTTSVTSWATENDLPYAQISELASTVVVQGVRGQARRRRRRARAGHAGQPAPARCTSPTATTTGRLPTAAAAGRRRPPGGPRRVARQHRARLLRGGSHDVRPRAEPPAAEQGPRRVRRGCQRVTDGRSTSAVGALGVTVEVGVRGDRAAEVGSRLPELWELCPPTPGAAVGGRVEVVFDSRPEVVEAADRAGLVSREELEDLLQLVTQRVTVAAIDALAGQCLMLHAACLAAPSTGDAVAFVAPGGTGKTTLAATLGPGRWYVTDETTAVRADGTVIPYPKPLSVRRAPDSLYKDETAPGALGLVAPTGPVRLSAVCLLDRDDRHTGAPRMTRLGTLDGIVDLVPQTSHLTGCRGPLQRLAGLTESPRWGASGHLPGGGRPRRAVRRLTDGR